MTTAHIDPTQMPLNDIQKNAVEAINAKGLETFVGNTHWSPVQKSFKDAFEKIRQDPAAQISFQDACAKEMTKPETRKFLDEELAGLTKTVFRIKADFEKVATTVGRFDKQKFRKLKPDGTSGGDFIEPLLPPWKEFQKTFDDLVVESKKAATNGIGQARKYRQVILEMAANPGEMDDAVKEIEGFVDEVTKFENDSKDLSTHFDTLRSQISSFKTTLDMAIKDAGANVDKEIQETQSKIDEVKQELSKFQTMATIGWVSTIGGVGLGAGIGVAVGLGIVAMTPVGWLLAAAAAIAVVGGLIAGAVGELEKVRLNNELADLENKMKQLIDTQKEVEALKILFKKAESQIVDIANSINTISRIWAIFQMDANLLKTAINGAKTAKTRSGLVRQIKMAQAQYETLEANLETYVTKMAEIEDKPAD